MQLAIIYDADGNVLGLAASPPGAPVAYPETDAGQQVALVDAPELTDLAREELVTRLKDVVATYRLDLGKATATLVRK